MNVSKSVLIYKAVIDSRKKLVPCNRRGGVSLRVPVRRWKISQTEAPQPLQIRQGVNMRGSGVSKRLLYIYIHCAA
jgi:hypothetical protein